MSDCLETRKILVNLYISECVEKNHLFWAEIQNENTLQSFEWEVDKTRALDDSSRRKLVIILILSFA